jgi:carboxyl-terminal processing protease
MVLSKRMLVLGATTVTVAAVAIAGASIHFPKVSAMLQLQDNPKEIVDEVWHVIDRSYVDGTFNQNDWESVRKEYVRPYKDKQEAYKSVREMLKKLGDPYTRFMDPDEYRNMKIDTSGELIGVGIQLGADEKSKRPMVIAPIEGSPAAAAGILSKDIIIKIDGKSTEGMDDKAAVNLIRGKANTKVKLTVLRGTKEIDFELKRQVIALHPVRFNQQKGPNGEDIGYIRLSQFSAPAVKEMRDAIENLEKQNVGGYVLDLRSNPGGLLDASVEIARMWLKQGGIVSTVTREGNTDRKNANATHLTQKPMVVLVDGGSASASEILSGALQDNNRAKIIGTKTFGKGLVQSVREIISDDGESGMAVTIAKYLTPLGRDINKHGIDPDVEIKLSEQDQKNLLSDRDKIGTPADPQFAKALQVLLQDANAKQAKS